MIIRKIGTGAVGGETFAVLNEQITSKNVAVLLDFLGLKKDVSGVQKVSADVELIASVPFQIKKAAKKDDQQNLDFEESGQQEGFAWTLSTFDLDRFDERVDPQGWDFKRFLNNPVVEWSHRYDIPAIGKIENLRADENGLHGVVIFNDKSFDPFGWSIGERVKNGVIRAGSVGFRVMEIEIPSKEDAPNGGKDGTALIFRKQELLEFSICNVPANPFALVKNNYEQRTVEPLVRNKENEIIKSDFAVPYWGGLINNFKE